LPAATTPEGAGQRIELGLTALKDKIRPNLKGSKKLNNLMEKAWAKVDGMLTEAENSGSMVNRDALFKYWDKLMDDYGAPTNLEGKKDAAVLTRMRKIYMDNLDKVAGGETLLSPREVHQFKKRIYETLTPKDFNAPRPQGARKAGLRSASKAAKEELETIVPGIDVANQRFSELARLRDAMPGPTARLANLSSIPFGASLKTAAGGTVGGMLGGPLGAKIGTGLGMALGAVDTPSFKFGLAERLFDAINNPILDPRAKREAAAHLRQILAETGQLQGVNPEMFAPTP